jgi:hypothetical protein
MAERNAVSGPDISLQQQKIFVELFLSQRLIAINGKGARLSIG